MVSHLRLALHACIAVSLTNLIHSNVTAQDNAGKFATVSHECDQELESDKSQQTLASKDPYRLTFADFVSRDSEQWVGSEKTLEPIAGSQPIAFDVDLESAIDRYSKKVTTADPNPSDLTILGRLYLRQAKEHDRLGSYRLSEDTLRRALEIAPEVPAARLALAQSLMASHQFQEALRMIQSLIDEGLNTPAAQAALFDANLELGHYSEAEAALARLQKMESSPPVLARAARMQELKGNYAGACELIEKAIADLSATADSPRRSVWYHWRLGCIRLQSGDLAGAEQAFDDGLEIEPDDEACLVGAARTAFALEKLDQAQLLLEKAALSDAPPVLSLLGDLYAHRGNRHRAEQLWMKTEAVMREEAKVARVAHAREVALFFADRERNLAEAEKLAAIDFTQRQDPFAWDCRAWVACRSGKLRDASDSIQHALELAPHAPQILFHAAVIANAQGQSDLVRKYTGQLIASNPRFSITYYRELHDLIPH